MAYGEWAPYVSVAQRRARADRAMRQLEKTGFRVEPIKTKGRKIAHTFWGEAWCNHLEKFSDYENRLPRGRTYVRNGSICHLTISEGKVEAIVSGSELYEIEIDITPLSAKKWKKLREQCAGQVGSMLELLQGRFSDNVMAIVTDPENGLFPQPNEIKLNCDCPDWAEMCKHIAAVLYGVGARLDQQPELLFLLRNVDHEALITAELDMTSATAGQSKGRRLATSDLSDVFGIDMDEPVTPARKKPGRKKSVSKKSISKKSVKKPVKKTLKKATRKTVKKKQTAKTTKKPFTPTAAGVRRLRKQFGMNSSQFAKLLGISSPTVSNWESSSGKLKLRQNNQKSLGKIFELTPEQAARKLKKIQRNER